MRVEYNTAIETRLEWLRWLDAGNWKKWPDRFAGAVQSVYRPPLEEGETFFMDEHFCDLVDHARRTVPDDLKFEREWVLRPSGFLYLSKPFAVPHLKGEADNPEWKEIPITVRAIGWTTIPEGASILHGDDPTEVAPVGATYFRGYLSNQDFPSRLEILDRGFAPWSYFVLRDGQVLGKRILDFETRNAKVDPGAEYAGRGSSSLHEVRWIYAAMHLMAQRLAVRVRHHSDRATRRRIEHQGERAPPFIEVITLRRLEAARKRDLSTPREWNFQWEVRGHWRNQWYAKDRIHKPKFIEAFVKGPPGMPFKEHGTKLFVAKR